MMILNKKFKNMDYIKIGHEIQISGAIFSDSERSYIVNLPDEKINQKIWNIEMSHEDWKELLRQSDIQEAYVLMEDEGNIKRAIIRKSARQIDSRVSWNVYRRDKYTCRYCGRNDVPLTIDHLILWEDGGPTIEENLVSSCRKCNHTRGNMKYEDWHNSKEYIKLSGGLDLDVVKENYLLIEKIKSIPIKLHIPKRSSSKKKKKQRG
jgi:hypothetical protein